MVLKDENCPFALNKYYKYWLSLTKFEIKIKT